MLSRSLRHRAPVLWLLLPFMGGLIAAKLSPAAPPVGGLVAGAVAAGLAACFLSQRWPRAWAGALCLALGLGGAAAYEIHRARLAAWDALPPREARVTLRVERTFASSNNKRVSGIARISHAEAHLAELTGQRVYFSLAPGASASPAASASAPSAPPERSTEIAAVGLLRPLPRTAAVASFDGYLVAAGANFTLTRGRLLDVVHPPSPYARFRARALERFSVALGRGLERHPEIAGTLRAMMLGQSRELSEAQTTRFRQSGTMHLFAISGLHIGVIAALLQGLASVSRLPRGVRLPLTLLALWLYVDITGASPSSVRAFIMVALVLGSHAARLPVNPVATLSFAAFVSLLIEPMDLFSASFQMSYGIVAALLLLGLPLADRWQQRWSPFRDLPKATWTWRHRASEVVWRWLASALAIGVAASVVSTVFGLIYFQLFTPGSLLANLLLIPASSAVICAGFFSLVVGLVGLSPLCWLGNAIAGATLHAMELTLVQFVRLPGMFHPAAFAQAWLGWLALGALVASLLHGYAHGWLNRRGGFWPPFALTALALVLAVKFN